MMSEKRRRALIAYSGGGAVVLEEDTPMIANMRELRDRARIARWDNPQVKAVMASPPTLAMSASATGALSNLYTVTGSTAGVLRNTGGAPTALFSDYLRFRSATVSGAASYSIWRTEFIADALEVEVNVWATALTQGFRVIVDGQYASLSYTNAVAANAANYFKITFATRARRHIIVEGVLQTGIRRVAVGPTEGIYRVPGKAYRIFYQGDSFMASSTDDAHHDGMAAVCSKLLGVEDTWAGGIGGTGWLNPGTGQTTFLQRNLSDVVAAAPNAVVIMGGYNDTAYPTADLTAAVSLWINQTRASLPNATFFVLGPFASRTGPSASILAAENAIKAGVDQVNDPFTFFIPNSTDVNGPWMSGTGRVGATTGVGNADIYVNTGGVHLTASGYVFAGERIADAIMRTLDNRLMP